MQQSGREMQGMASSLNGIPSPAAQIALQELQNGHRQQQIQNPALQVPAAHFDHSTGGAGEATGHDDFIDQMLSSLPSSWPDLGNPRSPWDLTSSSNPNCSPAGAADMSSGQKLLNIGLAGKSPEQSAAEAAEGLHYAPYDESALLASRLRQHQISAGSSPAGKPMVLQLNHHHQQHQQQMLLQGMGRSPVAASGGDSGLLPLPLSLGSGGSADSRFLVDRSRDEVDPSFKSPDPTGEEGLYNAFGGSLQRAAQAATQQHFHHPQGASMPAQNFGGAPSAGVGQAAAVAGGGSAPPRQRVRARRGQATDPHSIAERLRRERIAERMKALQELVPNANKTDKASMLDEIIDYVKFLQLQVKVLSMSRLGGAAAVAPLASDMSSEGQSGRGGGSNGAAGNDGLTVTEHQVAKLMEEDMGSAMQYLQGKGLCLMPISLASAISSATCHPRPAAGGSGAAANGGGAHHLNPGHIPAPPPPTHNNPANGPGGGDAPSSPSLSVLTVQSAMGNSVDADVSLPTVKDAASISKT